MAELQDYNSTPKYETFSYLPAMTPEQVRKQIVYLISQGWNPAIEHVEPENASRYFWYTRKANVTEKEKDEPVKKEKTNKDDNKKKE